jgi:hypothetical protein
MRKILLISCSTILVLAFGVFVLEKTHVINLYHKSITQTSSVKPVNTIDYSPATTTDNANNDQIKQNSLNSAPQTKPLSVTITRAMQDINTKSLIVRALVDGATTGNCTLELRQNSGPAELSEQVALTQQNNVFTCNGFDIPQSELPGFGEWTIKITVNGGANTANAVQNIMIEK